MSGSLSQEEIDELLRQQAQAGDQTEQAEDESTCAVRGMPRAVTEAGLTQGVFPLGAIPTAVAEAVSTRRP